MDMPWRKRSARRDEGVDREIADHVERLTEDFIAQGMSPEEARRRASVEFGGREQVKQQVREVHLWALGEAMRFHVRAAIRFMIKAPGFSLAVILTLALGIGANSAVFSAIDAIVLRPLAFPHGDELVRIYQRNARRSDANTFVAPQRLEDWNRMASTFSGITGYYKDDLSELSGPLPEKVTEALVAARFLNVLGVAPALGRNFTPEEEHWGGRASILISHGFWQRRFNGDPGVLNRDLRVDKFTLSIVGVMPEGFAFPDKDVDIWQVSAPDAPFAQRREATWFTVIGRMKPGVVVKVAAADLETVQKQLGKQYPKPDADLTTEMSPLKATVIGEVGKSLWLLYGSVSLLLLIACSNIAALLLARTAEREQEIAIRPECTGACRRRIRSDPRAHATGERVVGRDHRHERGGAAHQPHARRTSDPAGCGGRCHRSHAAWGWGAVSIGVQCGRQVRSGEKDPGRDTLGLVWVLQHHEDPGAGGRAVRPFVHNAGGAGQQELCQSLPGRRCRTGACDQGGSL
jgi:hypothetical protein